MQIALIVLETQSVWLIFALRFCRAAKAGDDALNLAARNQGDANTAIDLAEYKILRGIKMDI